MKNVATVSDALRKDCEIVRRSIEPHKILIRLKRGNSFRFRFRSNQMYEIKLYDENKKINAIHRVNTLFTNSTSYNI